MKDIGERLKSYEPLWENWYVDKRIGGGNFGKVYRLKQNFMGMTRYSAVKIIQNDLGQELVINKINNQNLIEEKKAIVSQEITNMYKLSGKQYLVQCMAHNIKDLYDESNNIVGFDVLIQMPLLLPMTEYMKENDNLTIDQIERLALQIGRALKSMHSINMIHRDIKPQNIYIDDNFNFLLGDFGVSKQVQSSNYSTMAGTEPFIAPEVWKLSQTNKRYDKTADIYSFGITLYYLLNDNMLPLTNEDSTYNDIEVAKNDRLNGKVFPPPKNGSEKLKAIVMKCCKYKPKNRYQSMEEVLSDLEKLNKVFDNTITDAVKQKDNDRQKISTKPTDAYKTLYADDLIDNEIEYKTAYANNDDSTKPVFKKTNAKIKVAATIAAVVLVAGGFSLWYALHKNDVKADYNTNSSMVSKSTKLELTYNSVPKGTISSGAFHTVGLKNDGTVVAIGENKSGQCDVSEWTDIVKISSGDDHTVGLKSDGTVVAVGANRMRQCNVSDWTDIVEISAISEHTVGLKSDGTVVAVGGGGHELLEWKDIVAISAGRGITAGLKSDGTVVVAGDNTIDVSTLTDIVEISAGTGCIIGLKSDGTVVAVGDNRLGQCNVSDWTDIVAISSGLAHTVGLKSDGTVVATNVLDKTMDAGQCDISEWSDIVEISTGWYNTVGLKSDGSVVVVGSNAVSQCNVSDWTNIKTDNNA